MRAPVFLLRGKKRYVISEVSEEQQCLYNTKEAV